MGKKKLNQWIMKDDICIGITSKGDKFIIDRDDFDEVSQYTWNVGNRGYVLANINGKTVMLHKFIAGISLMIDHKDLNKLNCRRNNLRPCTDQQNKCNMSLRCNNTSGHKGVKYNQKDKLWRASITRNGKYIYLGGYKTFEQAVAARDAKTLELDGEFVCLN